MYKPPFSSFKRPAADPMQPIAARAGSQVQPGGTKVFNCPTISKGNQGPVKPQPRIQLVDHRNTRMDERNVDRHKDVVTAPMATMSVQADKDNPDFVEKEMPDAKMAEFWVFPEECQSVFIDKRTGLAYANVHIIGVNGRQFVLFPGKNKAPGFVYEALEDHREMQKRFKDKLAPAKSSGRSVIMNRNPQGYKSMMTDPNLFNDSMLGRPNFYDSSIDMQAKEIMRRHREQALRKK